MANKWRDKARFDTKTLFGFFIKSVTDEEGNPLEVGATEVIVTGECGRKWKLHHENDCCEHVRLTDIVGDVSDLEGAMIYHAEEVSNDMIVAPSRGEDGYQDSHTWTYYKLRTSKGYVDLRWLGESNGYYSESVEFSVQREVKVEGVTIPYDYRQWEWAND